MKVNICQNSFEISSLSEEDLNCLKLDVNLSDRKLLKIMRLIRLKWGRKSIIKNIRVKLVERETFFQDLYTLEKIEFGDTNKTFFIFCHNIEESFVLYFILFFLR